MKRQEHKSTIMLKRRYAFLVWLLGSLISIAVIGENLYLGLALAIIAGILFGIANLLAFKNPEG